MGFKADIINTQIKTLICDCVALLTHLLICQFSET